MITQPLTPKRSYQLQNSSGNLINRNNRLLLRDNASQELKYNIDVDLVPSQIAATPYTDAIPSQTLPVEHHPRNPTPPKTPTPQPVRRSNRVSKKPQFYGNPVTH